MNSATDFTPTSAPATTQEVAPAPQDTPAAEKPKSKLQLNKNNIFPAPFNPEPLGDNSQLKGNSLNAKLNPNKIFEPVTAPTPNLIPQVNNIPTFNQYPQPSYNNFGYMNPMAMGNYMGNQYGGFNNMGMSTGMNMNHNMFNMMGGGMNNMMGSMNNMFQQPQQNNLNAQAFGIQSPVANVIPKVNNNIAQTNKAETQQSSLNTLLGSGSTQTNNIPIKNNPQLLTATLGNVKSTTDANFSNYDTNRLAKLLKEKKDKESGIAEEKTESQAISEREKKLKDEERKNAENALKNDQLVSDLRKEFPKSDEEGDNAVDEASEDSESYHSVGEDLSLLPQERPPVLRWTKKMILDFVKKESKKPLEDDYIFECLVREISKVTRKDAGMFDRGSNNRGTGGYRGERPNDRGNGRYDNRNNDKYGSRNDVRRGNDRYGDRDRRDGYEPQQTTLSRNKMSEETATKLRELRNDTDDWSKRNTSIATENEVLKREINLKLFLVTPENFEFVMKECHEFCNTVDNCELFINILIDKAWVQYKYTKLYAKLCIKLGEVTWPWATGKTAEDKAVASKKRYKNFVVTKIRKEFLHGFRKFKENMVKWHKDPEIDDDFLFEKYVKDKEKLKGNITLISELYLLSYLPHKVMRFIAYKLITQFCDEIRQAAEDDIELKYPIYNEYLDSLFQLFKMSGAKVMAKENKATQKQRETNTVLCSNAELDKLVEHLAQSCKDKNFNYDKAKIVINDDHRKEADCVELSFKFMNALVAKSVLSARMEALVVNLNQNKKDGFKQDRTAQVGPMKLKDFHNEMIKESQPKRDTRGNDRFADGKRGGSSRFDDGPYYKKSSSNFDGRDKYQSKGNKYDKYEDEEEDVEYTKKSENKKSANLTSMSKIPEKEEETQEDVYQIASEEISGLFKSTKKEASFDPYEEFFGFSNENINLLSFEQIMELWFKHYHDCFANTALERAKIPSLLFTEWKAKEDELLRSLSKGFKDLALEDIPHKNKSLAAMLIHLYTEHKVNIGNLVWSYAAEQNKWDDAHWFYKDLMEQFEKTAEASGVGAELKPIAQALTAQAKAYKDHAGK